MTTEHNAQDMNAGAGQQVRQPDVALLVGGKTKSIRKARGLSRRALAEAAGVSERYLSMLEKGDGNVSIVLLGRIAHALGVTLADLVSDDKG